MQAVILAAGRSSRFYPYNSFPHKSFSTILGKTIIEHTIESIKKSGISDIIIVTGKNEFVHDVVGSGDKQGVKVTYVTQPEPLGMGDALLHAKEYITGDFFLLNAAKIDFHEFKDILLEKPKEKEEIMLLARQVSNPEHFGVLKHDGHKVLEIVEKPAKGTEPSNLKVVGIYLLSQAFLSELEHVKNEEYSLEAAISSYALKGKVKFVETDKKDVSLKYAWDVLQVSRYLLENTPAYKGENVSISDRAVISGDVIIDDGAKILEGAIVKGPCYIGKNVVIGNNAIVRDASVIESDCVIGAYTEVKNSIFFQGAKIHSGFVGNSLIGAGSKIGAYFCTANRRLDRGEIQVHIKNGKVNTHQTFLGAIIGDNARIGIHVAAMPGVIIGNNAIVGPSTTVMKNISDNTKFFTVFKDVVEASVEE